MSRQELYKGKRIRGREMNCGIRFEIIGILKVLLVIAGYLV